MPGPTSPDEALAWIKAAFHEGRYITSVHFGERLVERHVDMLDVGVAIARATKCIAYTNGTVQHEGTPWRVYGPDADGEREIAVGVEAFLDKKRRRIVVCTVIVV